MGTPHLRGLIAIVTWRSQATPRSAERLAGLIRQGDTSPTFLGNLTYGYWARDLPLESIVDIVDAAKSREDPGAGPAALAFIEQYLETHRDELPRLSEQAFLTLESCIGRSLNAMDEHYWSSLAELLLPIDLERLAALAVATLRNEPRESYSTRDEVVRALGIALDRGGWDLFERLVAPALLEEPILVLKLGWNLSDAGWFPLGEPAKSITWVEGDEEARLNIILQFTPVHGSPLPELTRRMLATWGTRNAVRASLSGRFMTGSWSGSTVLHYQKLRAEAVSWLGDVEPNVQKWAKEIVEHLDRNIIRETKEEEEDMLS
jgi:hypothetical protein